MESHMSFRTTAMLGCVLMSVPLVVTACGDQGSIVAIPGTSSQEICPKLTSLKLESDPSDSPADIAKMMKTFVTDINSAAAGVSGSLGDAMTTLSRKVEEISKMLDELDDTNSQDLADYFRKSAKTLASDDYRKAYLTVGGYSKQFCGEVHLGKKTLSQEEFQSIDLSNIDAEVTRFTPNFETRAKAATDSADDIEAKAEAAAKKAAEEAAANQPTSTGPQGGTGLPPGVVRDKFIEGMTSGNEVTAAQANCVADQISMDDLIALTKNSDDPSAKQRMINITIDCLR